MKRRGKIFVPFIDGILDYDCRECGQFCCQTGCIILNGKEKKMLLQERPSLKYFYDGDRKKTYHLQRYTRCWFLESSGLCCIQKKYGYASKPFGCRVYPLYISRCADEYVVLPDDCPALYINRGSKDEKSSYESIFKNARESIDNNYIHGEMLWPKKRLNLEKRIFEDSKAFLDNSSYLDFSVHQISMTTKNRTVEDIRSDLLERIKLWKSFFNIDDLDINNKILTFELTAITSLLRTASDGLRRMKEDKVPLVLLAIYFYMILFSQIRKRKNYVATYLQMLDRVPLGLSYLGKEGLEIKNTSIENKINYLKRLRKVWEYEALYKTKNMQSK